MSSRNVDHAAKLAKPYKSSFHLCHTHTTTQHTQQQPTPTHTTHTTTTKATSLSFKNVSNWAGDLNNIATFNFESCTNFLMNSSSLSMLRICFRVRSNHFPREPEPYNKHVCCSRHIYQDTNKTQADNAGLHKPHKKQRGRHFEVGSSLGSKQRQG